MTTLFEIPLERLDGSGDQMSNYHGKVILVVNVASRCGFTPQYAGLEALYQRYHAEGFVILGFPCNQFGGQEPGTSEEIAQFCDTRYAVSFPIFAKTDVNGEHTHPLWAQLKQGAPGLLGTEAIKWNFTKFLVDRSGTRITRYAPNDTPERIGQDLPALLAATA